MLHPQENTYGMLLYSRRELIEPQVAFLIEPDVPSIHATLRVRLRPARARAPSHAMPNCSSSAFGSDHFPVYIHLSHEPDAELKQLEPEATPEEQEETRKKIAKAAPENA